MYAYGLGLQDLSLISKTVQSSANDWTLPDFESNLTQHKYFAEEVFYDSIRFSSIIRLSASKQLNFITYQYYMWKCFCVAQDNDIIRILHFKVLPLADSIGKVNITAKLSKKKWKQFKDSGDVKIRRKFKVFSPFTKEF